VNCRERNGGDGRGFEVRNARLQELRTLKFELRISPVALVPPFTPDVSDFSD